jgi:hypothetical protein
MSLIPTGSDSREEALRDRIRDLYEIFRRYPLAEEIAPDPAFPGFCDDRPLRAEPLQHLPASAFEHYQGKAITTWGSVDDFKHFLPRMLELIAAPFDPAELPHVDKYLVLTKLQYGQWRRWPQPEQQALDAYFNSLWDARLLRPLDVNAWIRQDSVLDWLRDLAEVQVDLHGFLSQWEVDIRGSLGLMAAAHLADSIMQETARLLKKNSLEWSKGLKDHEDQVTAWLASGVVSTLLEGAFFRWSDTPYAALISEAHNWQDWWRLRRSGGI